MLNLIFLSGALIQALKKMLFSQAMLSVGDQEGLHSQFLLYINVQI